MGLWFPSLGNMSYHSSETLKGYVDFEVLMPWTCPEACRAVVVYEAWDDTQRAAHRVLLITCLSFVLT